MGLDSCISLQGPETSITHHFEPRIPKLYYCTNEQQWQV